MVTGPDMERKETNRSDARKVKSGESCAGGRMSWTALKMQPTMLLKIMVCKQVFS